jgi:small subunit ribosomal protein S2
MTKGLKLPEIGEILKTGLQFGHNRSRWNPKMSKFIFTEKNGIHVIDVIKTRELLEVAVNALMKLAADKEIVFIANKRQAAGIVEAEAIRVGAHFVVSRWPGGLFTNFEMTRRSLQRLTDLESMFENGVEGRTKYEVQQLKNEWGRLNRLYRGVKQMTKLPAAMVIVDPVFERVAIKEAKLLGVPVFALTDTNCNPDVVDYLIPGNDDALRSIEMVVTLLAEAVLTGNGGKGIKHSLKDYSNYNVDLVKQNAVKEEEIVEIPQQHVEEQQRVRLPATKAKPQSAGKGILEKVKEQTK